MAIGVVFLIVALIIIGIYLIFGLKRVKHKFFSLFLIFLVLFLFVSFTIVFGGKNISVNNISDLGNLANTYFSWLGNIFGNFKIITTNAIKMDWQGNKTT